MAGSQCPQITAEQLLSPLDEAITKYEASCNFSCNGTIGRFRGFSSSKSGTHYGDFTSKKEAIKCAPITIRWDGKDNVLKKTTFGSTPSYRNFKSSLEDLVQDCKPATFGFDGEDVLDEAVRKAGKLEKYEFSTNFNPYDYGIVDTIARELLPGIVRAGREPAVDRWGVIAELYKLNVYSGPSGMFKPHIDTPRGRTQFGSLVVCLPSEFEGGQLRVTHKGKEQVFSLGTESAYGIDYSDIQWAAFYSDCEHEVLPVLSGHRVTLTYQLYVSEDVGGLAQPRFQSPDSKVYPLYRSINDLLSSHIFMKKGGVLGFPCSYRYPQRVDGTYFYERYPLTLKGIDAVLFAIFRALGLIVHIKAREFYMYKNDDNAENRYRGISSQDDTGNESEVQDVSANSFGAAEPISDFEKSGYVGEEIFRSVTWFNEWVTKEGGKEYQEVAQPIAPWIGNEIEIEWEYAYIALLVVVPEFPKRDLR